MDAPRGDPGDARRGDASRFIDAIHFVAAVATVSAVVAAIGAAAALRSVPARPEPAIDMESTPAGATD
jgi:hypothetical protein